MRQTVLVFGLVMAVLDTLKWLGETLDKPGAAARGLLAGQPGQLANLIPFSDTMGITDPRERVSGREMLQSWGALGQNKPGLDMGDVAGFGAELATDPLNIFGAGLAARTALKARAARAANAPSLAMREAGALPEEMLPDAIKVFREAHADDITAVPGKYNPQLDEVGSSPLMRTDPRTLSFHSRGILRGELNPASRTLDQDDLRAIAGRVNEGLESMNPDIARVVEPGAQKSLALLQSQKPFTFGYGTDLAPGINPEMLDGLTRRVRAEHLKKVRDEFGEMYNPGRMFGQEMSEDLKFALDDYMASEGNQLARQNAMRDLGVIGDTKTLMDEVVESTIPARMASESFYAVPKKPVVNLADEIDAGLMQSANRNLPEDQIAHIQQMAAAEKPPTYYDISYGRHPKPGGESVYYDLPKAPDIGATVDPKIGGARIEPGADTYLPNVAPALQNVPRIDRRALMAWMGQNALAPMGRQ